MPPILKGTASQPTAPCGNPVAHVRTEFGFDVLQVVSGRYAPDRYRSFIGFQVSRDVMERAFLDTYGIEMKDVFGNVTLAIGSYRYSIKSIIPGMTKVAWSLKQDQLKKEIPGVTRKKFLSIISRVRALKRNGERSTRSRAAALGSWRSSSAGYRGAVPSAR